MHAAKHGNVRIIFPMVSVAEVLAQIDALYRRVAAAAKIDEPPEWGIMLEVPSAAFMLDAIADYTNYISLGTNDLLQFFYAIDRTNEKLAGLAGHMSQPFLRLIYKLVKRAEELGIKVGVCGEMASDPAGFVALLGAGVGEVSIRPAAAAKISAMIPQLERGRLMKFMPELVLEQKNADVRKEILNEFPNLTEFFT
jgi:phosphoenolpyruvate-protein kinase (PTS system EI component)